MNKLMQVYELLFERFGKQKWWPTVSDNEQFEICVGAILTQNTAWTNVEKAIKNLKENKLLSKEAILNVDKNKLANLIKSAGYFNQKAKKLKEFAKFDGEIKRENLLNIWGIGLETADSILLYAYNEPIFVIDAYTKRIFFRIGFKEESYEKLQNLFMKNLSKDAKLFNEYHALIVELAKEHCRTEPECRNCPLNQICETGKSNI